MQTYSLPQVMQQVLLALVPGVAVMLWLFGWGILTNLVLCSGFALALEALMLHLRKRPIQPFLTDYSALVTAWLVALAVPPFAPWWLLLLGMLFAIVIAKHLYGGIGYNPFNPAMIAYAALLVSYPLQMTTWPNPVHGFGGVSLSDSLAHVFLGSNTGWDAYTGATALDSMKIGLGLNHPPEQLATHPSLGFISGRGWEWVNLAYLIGGGWLLYKRLITWHIPVASLVGLSGFALLFWVWNPTHYPTPLFHLLGGATMLGAFFIATDPVTASTTPVGKLVFGASIGGLVYVIRTWGGYPDGVAFAVIVMNMAVPLIDKYTQPRVYGQRWHL